MGIIYDHMMDKAAIFIDGAYLNRVLKYQFNKASIDYYKLSEEICSSLNLDRLRTYYYHCMPIIRKGNKNDEIRHSKKQKFVSKLQKLPRFEVKAGKLQYIGKQFRQKRVDVLMSLDIVNMCFDRQITHAILVAGDSDFIPAIKKAKAYGAIVHLYYHPSSVHQAILNAVDERHEIDEDLIEKCKKL